MATFLTFHASVWQSYGWQQMGHQIQMVRILTFAYILHFLFTCLVERGLQRMGHPVVTIFWRQWPPSPFYFLTCFACQLFECLSFKFFKLVFLCFWVFLLLFFYFYIHILFTPLQQMGHRVVTICWQQPPPPPFHFLHSYHFIFYLFIVRFFLAFFFFNFSTTDGSSSGDNLLAAVTPSPLWHETQPPPWYIQQHARDEGGTNSNSKVSSFSSWTKLPCLVEGKAYL